MIGPHRVNMTVYLALAGNGEPVSSFTLEDGIKAVEDRLKK